MEMTFVAFLTVSSTCDTFHSWKILHKGGPLISLTQDDGKDAIKYNFKCINSQFMKIITSLHLRQIIVPPYFPTKDALSTNFVVVG